jgi:hypothetical protein
LKHQEQKPNNINGIKDFFKQFYLKVMKSCSIGHDKKLFTFIQIEQIPEIDVLDFKMSNDDKLKLFIKGTSFFYV